MKLHLVPVLALTFSAALTLSTPAAFAATAEGTFERTLHVTGTTNLSIATGSGYIHVYPGSRGSGSADQGAGDQIHILGHVHVRTGMFNSDAEGRLKQILAAPPVLQSGNTVTVGANHSDDGLFRNVSIDYDVTTPASTTLKASSGSGSLEIGGILGAVSAETGSGGIHAENIGPNSRLETGSGSIRALSVHGAATLQTGSGDLDLTLNAPGDVKAETGSGSIHVDGVAGSLRATTGSGSIEAGGNPTFDWKLESGSGEIHLRLAADARFRLDAESGSGSVHVDRPILMQGGLNQHHVSGTVNGGGPTVRAETGSGSITLK